MRLVLPWVMVALLLPLHSSTGWAKRRRRRPAAQPVINPGSERTVAPSPTELAPRPAEDDVAKTVVGWYRKLARQLTPTGAWVVVSSPLWLPLLLWLVVKVARARARRTPRPGVTRAPVSMPELSISAEAPPMPKQRPLDPAAALMLVGSPVGDATSKASPSLHETFTAIAPAQDTFLAFRKALASLTDSKTYRELQKEPDPDWIARLRACWIKGLARLRVYGWLTEHPLVTGESLVVQMPDELEAAALDGIALLQTSGLAVKLDSLQDQLLRQARRALGMVYRSDGDPYLLRVVKRNLELPALLFGPNDTATDDQGFWLSLVLFGQVALERANALGSKLPQSEELAVAFAKHKASFSEPITGEGLIVAMLSENPALSLPGTGGFFASVAGAAFSPAAVALQLSKHSASVAGGVQKRLSRVGREVAQIFSDPTSTSLRDRLIDNFHQLIGQRQLEREQQAARALFDVLDHRPLWPDMKSTESPDTVLARLHEARVGRAAAEVNRVSARLQQVFAKLSFAGRAKRDREIAAVRFGYAVAALGTRFLDGVEQGLVEDAVVAADALRARPRG